MLNYAQEHKLCAFAPLREIESSVEKACKADIFVDQYQFLAELRRSDIEKKEILNVE